MVADVVDIKSVGHKSWMADVPLSRLKVDPSYQRRHEAPSSKQRIEHMAENYDERLEEAITVSIRQDGWWVVNGGHRFLAARKAGRKTIKAICWEGLNRDEEAWVFGAINTGTVRPKAVDIFRARLGSNEPNALNIQLVATQSDVKLDLNYGGWAAQTPDVCKAVAALDTVYRAGGAELLGNTLRALRSAWPFESKALGAVPIFGVASFIDVYEIHPRYQYRRMVQKLAERPLRDYLQRARELGSMGTAGGGPTMKRLKGAALLQKAGPRRGVLAAYNHRLRDPLPDVTAADFKAMEWGRNPWVDEEQVER